MTGERKTCAHCNEERPRAEFYRDAKAKDGLQAGAAGATRTTGGVGSAGTSLAQWRPTRRWRGSLSLTGLCSAADN